MFIYRTVQELGKHYKITVLVLYPVNPPFIPMLKNLRDWKKIYTDWKAAFPRKPQIPPGLEHIHVYYIKYVRPPRMNYLDIEAWFSYMTLKKFFKKIYKEKYNTTIHAAWIFPSGHAANILSKKFDLPYIVTLMGSDVNFIKQNTLRFNSAVKILRGSSKITSVSQNLIEKLIKKGLLKDNSNTALTHTIYNFSKFNINDKAGARMELGLDLNKKMIFFAGSLRKLKNVNVLIKTVAVLLKEEPDLILVIAGSGYEEENLRRLVEKENLKDIVKFLGNINEDLMIKNYNAANVFCLPSQSEGTPNVIIEALLCGTAVVASKVGEIPLLIENGKNGFLVEPDSVISLKEKLSEALNVEWNREELRKSILRLSPGIVLQEYDKVYGKLLNQNNVGYNKFR